MGACLPIDVVEHLLGLLPPGARQWSAAKVNKRMHRLFADKAFKISARDPDLPTWVLDWFLNELLNGQGPHAAHQKNGNKASALLMEARAAAGDVAGVQLLHSRGLPWSDKTCTAAAAGGHLQLLRWLRCQSPPCPWGSAKASAEAAAGNGHLQVLQFIMQEHFLCSWDISVCAEVAAAQGHLPVLQWLASHTQSCPLDAGACAEASAGGHLDVLVWLRDQQTPWDVKTCILAAAAGGHLHILEYLRQHAPGSSCWDEWAPTVAAHAGRLPVLRWLRCLQPLPCPWSERTCCAAAAAGHLEVLRFLRADADNPCPWDETTTLSAAKAGHLHILIWSQQVQPPCRIDPAACMEAARYLHPDVTRWLLQEFGW